MKIRIIKIISWIMLIGSIFGLVHLIYLQFLNPDMTHTRFFMTYWKEYLYCIIPMIISKYIIDK
jgi:hypothetical protein